MLANSLLQAPDKAITTRINLSNGKQTTVHIVCYERAYIKPRLVCFDKKTLLSTWCGENNIQEALVGGFYLRTENKPLGELWIDGARQSSIAFVAPWHAIRGSLHIANNSVTIDHRDSLPAIPAGDLLQAGPMLVKDSKSLLTDPNDHEGFSAAWQQFDSDITQGRHPRAAIGINDSFIFSVVCDGRSSTDAGMTLAEMADMMTQLECTAALNLDGGGSATLISQGKLVNRPRGDGQEYSLGRPILTALIFESAA